MQIISFFNVKGGVGKTASAVNVAYNLSNKFKKRTLLIDLDPQANSSFFFNTDKKEYSISDVLKKTVSISESIYKTGYYKLDMIPSNNALWAFEKELLITQNKQQYILKDVLKEVKNMYDYVIIDCNNVVGSILVLNAFAASDYVFVPMRDEAFATNGLITTINVINEMKEYNPALTFGGCFYSSWEKRKVNIESFKSLKQAFGDKMLDIKIRKSKDVPETSYAHKPLLLYNKNGNATQDYLDLTKFILKKCD